MADASTNVRTTTILIASASVIGCGFLAYAAYFDYKRRSDPDFRKALRKESKREQRAAKEAAEAQDKQDEKAIQEVIDRTNDDELPTGLEDKESYFMQEVSRGEGLLQSGKPKPLKYPKLTHSYFGLGSDSLEAAACFYRALKVYPSPPDLISIYEKTVPKPVLDLLARILAGDPDMKVRLGGSSPNSSYDVDS